MTDARVTPADAPPAWVRPLLAELARLVPPDAPAGIGPADAAKLVGMSRSTFDTFVAAGLVPPPAAVGGKRIYCRAMLEAWVAHGCPPAAAFAPVWATRIAPAATPKRR